MKFTYTKQFIRQLDDYAQEVQKQILHTDQEIKQYTGSGRASYGLRIKKIGPHTFEARVSSRIRIIWQKFPDEVVFSLVGTHPEVKEFIRRLHR